MFQLSFRNLISGGLFVACAVGLGACSSDAASEETGSSEDQLLPNQAIIEGQADGTVYRRIAEYFAKHGGDLHVASTAGFAPAWPLVDPKPSVLNRLGTPMLFTNIGYFSTGFNVLRSSTITVSDEVRAPHGGKAVAFDWLGNRITALQNPYGTVVAIYDPVSHLITVMTHVNPVAAILSASDPTEVVAGAPVGKLARVPLGPDSGSAANRLANVEIAFLDGEQLKLIDPAKTFEAYRDTVAPEAKRLYFTNDARESVDRFRNGKFDLVVEAFDRDDASPRNLEVSAIGFVVRDQAGNTLLEQSRCELADIFGDLSAPQSIHIRDLVDFGSAIGQIGGSWPQSDVDNPQRTFRYALTQLTMDQNGRCKLQTDTDGALTIPNATMKLAVAVSLWDSKGNQSDKTFNISRVANSQEFAVGGTISGLVGEVTLASNGNELVVDENGEFLFTKPITVTTPYTVTVRKQPEHQRCTVNNASGDMGPANVTNVKVKCVNVRTISGTLTGLGASGISLQNNNTDLKRLTNDGTFSFSRAIEEGTAYKVTIFDQPDDKTCTVQNGVGTTSTFDIENVLVTCD